MQSQRVLRGLATSALMLFKCHRLAVGGPCEVEVEVLFGADNEGIHKGQGREDQGQAPKLRKVSLGSIYRGDVGSTTPTLNLQLIALQIATLL